MLINKLLHVYRSQEDSGEQGGGGGGEPAPEAGGQETPQEDLGEGDKGAGEQPPVQDPPKDDKNELPPKSEDKSKLGQVTSLVEQAGLDMADVAKLAKENDGKIDLDTMVALKEKHGEAIASLIADQIQSIHTERVEAVNKRDKEIFDQVKEAFKDVTEQTGEETWKELSGWAKDNVSNEHRAEINQLLAQGGLAAKLAVQELVSAFKEAQGNVEYQDADLLDGDNIPSGDGSLISKSDYNRELNELLQKGHVYGESREIAKLDARRAKSIQRGYK